MHFAVPNFVKTCMEAELNYFLSFCVPAYKGWIASWDIHSGLQSEAWKSGLGNYSRMDPGSWLWAGRGECSRMCLQDKTALMCPGTPAEQARVLSLSQNNHLWNLTNSKLFWRSEQESKAREAPCSIIIPEVCPSPFSWNSPPSSMHWSIVCIQQGASCTLLKWALHRPVGLSAKYQGCTNS